MADTERQRAKRGHATPKPEDGLTYIYPLRSNYTGDQFQLFMSGKGLSKLTAVARHQIALDHAYITTEIVNSALEEERAKLQELARAVKSNGTRKRKRIEPTKPQGRPEGACSKIAKHYGISKRAVTEIVAQAATEASVSPKKRSGRKKQGTPQQRDIRATVKKTFDDTHGVISLSNACSRMQGKIDWQTAYKGKSSSTMSSATLSRMLRDGSWKTQMERERPKLDETAINERKKFAPEALARDDTLVTCNDEAYICIAPKRRRLLIDLKAVPAGPDTEEEDMEAVPVRYDAGKAKGHEPKVFLFGATTEPKTTVDENGIYHIDKQFNGKVLLARVRGMRKRKAGPKLNNGEFFDGPIIYENITIDGPRYKELCEMKNGLFDSILQYHNPELRPAQYKTARVLCCDMDKSDVDKSKKWTDKCPVDIKFIAQEDGAPGHGYNNRAKGKETEVHAALAYNGTTMGIKLVKQSRHSPELNFLDLGVWHALKTAVEQRGNEVPVFVGNNANQVESAIWQIVQEEWEKLDPKKLFFISRQRRVLLEKCIELEGRSIEKEPHTGLRKKLRFE
jgi:transposase